MSGSGTRVLRWVVAVIAVFAVACATEPAGSPATPGPATGPAEPSGTIRLYTSVTEDTVAAVVDAWRSTHGDAEIEVLRAPTGELAGRIAAEQRQGGIRADVLWLTDPLSMQQYASQGLLRSWTPGELGAVPERFRQETFFGTRILNMVLVHQPDLDLAPAAWRDLAERDLPQPVAIPDPGFAGSAFGALGYFALAEDFGFDFYRALKERGAVQVQAPGDVVTGVAEGRYSAGMSLDKTAFTAVEKGSPVEVVFPEPGAIAMYSPIAVVAATTNAAAAESFANFTLTRDAQQAIAGTGWQPVRDDVAWDRGGPTVTPDWQEAFDRQDQLLEQYRTIFGG